MSDFMRKARFIIATAIGFGCLIAADVLDSPNLFGVAFLIAYFAGGMGGVICAYAKPPTD